MPLYVLKKKKKRQKNKKPSKSILYLHSAFWMRKHLTFIGSFSSVTALMVGRAVVHALFSERESESWGAQRVMKETQLPGGWAKGGAGGGGESPEAFLPPVPWQFQKVCREGYPKLGNNANGWFQGLPVSSRNTTSQTPKDALFSATDPKLSGLRIPHTFNNYWGLFK